MNRSNGSSVYSHVHSFVCSYVRMGGDTPSRQLALLPRTILFHPPFPSYSLARDLAIEGIPFVVDGLPKLKPHRYHHNGPISPPRNFFPRCFCIYVRCSGIGHISTPVPSKIFALATMKRQVPVKVRSMPRHILSDPNGSLTTVPELWL